MTKGKFPEKGIAMSVRILVVDDEPRYLRLLEANLLTEGYQVFTAMDGEEAVESFSANPVDLILLDLISLSVTPLSFPSARLLPDSDPRNLVAFRYLPHTRLTYHRTWETGLEAEIRVAVFSPAFFPRVPVVHAFPQCSSAFPWFKFFFSSIAPHAESREDSP